MVEQSIVAVVINQSVIRAAEVTGTTLNDPIEMDYAEDLLPRAFSVIKDRYHVSKIRLVLDEDLSHTLDLEIPLDTPEISERQTVEAKLKEQMPDILTAGNWDFRLKETSLTGKIMTVFVPVQSTFLEISRAAKNAGLEIEAVEPISLSTSRNPNPFIGVALKTDFSGSDEEVLNIQPVFSAQEETGMLNQVNPSVTPPSSSSASVNNSRKKTGKIIIIIGGVLLVALLAYGVITAVQKTAPTTASPTPTPTPVMTTPSPSPTPEPVDISELKVEVLNGSGIPGEAGKVAKLLVAEDFSDPDTGNADNYNYTSTEVSLKPGIPSSVYDIIELALGDDYTVKLGDELDEDSDYDVVIIVGVNANASPTPSPSSTPAPTASATPSPSTSPSPSASSSPSPSASSLPLTN